MKQQPDFLWFKHRFELYIPRGFCPTLNAITSSDDQECQIPMFESVPMLPKLDRFVVAVCPKEPNSHCIVAH